jgi:ubiquinone/menaquinone biosynthesis C-methylase UbiE
MTLTTTSPTAPGLWDAMRGIGVRRELPELLDNHEIPRAELAGNLAHLRLMNRWLLWSNAAWRDLAAILRRRGLRSATLLDVATGSADIPAALARRGLAHGIAIRAIGSDVSPLILAEARRWNGREVELVQHEGTRLPFRDESVDVAMCCLAAHHFAPDALGRLLAEMSRVARHGVLVADLARSRSNYLAARGMALVLRNPLTSHDGPVSVLRAYTPAELRSLAARAGLTRIRLRTFFPARMSLVAECETA